MTQHDEHREPSLMPALFCLVALVLVASDFALSGYRISNGVGRMHVSWRHIAHLLEKYPVYGAIIVFVATQTLAFGVRRYDEFMRRRQIRRGIYHEILHNIDTTARSHLDTASIDAMCTKILEKPPLERYRPLIVVTYEDVFYKAIAKDLPLLSRAEIKVINAYYYSMNQVKTAAESLERETFFMISPEGRVGLLRDIGEAYDEVVEEGVRAQSELGPGAALRRLSRFVKV